MRKNPTGMSFDDISNQYVIDAARAQGVKVEKKRLQPMELKNIWFIRVSCGLISQQKRINAAKNNGNVVVFCRLFETLGRKKRWHGSNALEWKIGYPLPLRRNVEPIQPSGGLAAKNLGKAAQTSTAVLLRERHPISF
jgi:hypothetical protein